MVGSPEVNKVIRRIISPALREKGFIKVRTRHNWRYLEDRIWYLMIKSVGSYFSDVAGYPPQSLVAEYGVYFTDFPPNPRPALRTEPKIDRDGLIIPKEYECHYRSSLRIIASQKDLRNSLTSSAEKNREDIWWVSKDGSNIYEAVEDMKQSVLGHAFPSMETVNKEAILERWSKQ